MKPNKRQAALTFLLLTSAGLSINCAHIPAATTASTGPFSPAPFSVVQAASPTYIKSGNTLTVSTSPTGNGHGLVAVVNGQDQDNYVTGCSDNASGNSNTYMPIPAATCTVYGSSPLTAGFINIFYVPSSKPGATTVSCTLHDSYPLGSNSGNPGGGDAELWLYELNQKINGVDNVAALNQQFETGSTALPGAQIATFSPYDWLLSSIYLYGVVQSVETPFTADIEPVSGNATAYDATGSTESTYRPTYVANVTQEYWCASTVAFK